MKVRLGIFGVFWLSGVVWALWSAAIPAVSTRLRLDETRMGVALLMTGIGAMVVMPAAGRLCDRWTSRTVLRVAGPIAAGSVAGPALAPSFPALLAALFVLGAGVGIVDVALNTQAIAVEAGHPKRIMSALHGVWAVGGVAGSAVTAAGAYLGLDPRVIMLGGAFAASALFLVTPLLLVAEHRPRRVARPAPAARSAVLPLGMIAFAAFVSEGAAFNWAALHASQVLGADLAIASLAYTCFAAAMTITRLLGDRLRDRFGPTGTIRLAGLAAVCGYLLVVVAPLLPAGRLPCTYAGWIVAGIGLATVVPVTFSAAGTGQAAVGHALSRVTAFGYVGLLGGPAVIGPVAETTTLGSAMLIPAALTAFIALAGPRTIRMATAGA